MEVRKPRVAGRFYPLDPSACARELGACLADEPPGLPAGREVLGVAVPHAGWDFSGATAGLAYSAVRQNRSPGTFVLLGASHSPYVSQPTLMASGAWETPLGVIEIDRDLALALLKSDTVQFVEDSDTHGPEHSLEVQVPFIQHLFDEVRIVPVIVPPIPDSHLVGRAVAEVVRDSGEDVVVVGSADLTHYGPGFRMTSHGAGPEANAWVRDVNDRRLVDLLLDLKADRIVAEAAERHNCCGSGALAALVTACVDLGADEAVILRQTTSYEARPDPVGHTIVGYVSMAFLGPTTSP